MNTVYKIVKLEHPNNYYRRTSLFEATGKAIYGKEVRTLPTYKNSFLYAFADLNDAKGYMEMVLVKGKNLELWKCDAETVDRVPEISTLNLWHGHLWDPNSYRDSSPAAAPEGTILCEWIELKKLLFSEEVLLQQNV